MWGVDIGGLINPPGSVKSSRSQSRKCSQMFNLSQSIFLGHKLGKLVGGEKFFESGLQWFWSYKLNRQSHIGVHRRHPVLHISFDLSHADTEFLLQKLAYILDSSTT